VNLVDRRLFDEPPRRGLTLLLFVEALLLLLLEAMLRWRLLMLVQGVGDDTRPSCCSRSEVTTVADGSGTTAKKFSHVSTRLRLRKTF